MIIGRQGSGKTLLALHKALNYYKRGFNVYSNVAFKFPYKRLKYSDIVECNLSNGVVIVDEAHQLLPSRNSMSKRSRLICDKFISMIRKKRLQVYMTTQTPRKIDIRIREECDYMFMVKKLGFIRGQWVEILTDELEKIPIKIIVTMIDMIDYKSVEFDFDANQYYNLYDTAEIIDIGEE